MSRVPSRGVFWVIDGELFAYPFREGLHAGGVAKSGNTYNHEGLWAELRISGRPFDHYPRGRVDVSSRGKTTIYVSPHLNDEGWLREIRDAFGVAGDQCRVIEDHSPHYRCSLDEGWHGRPDLERGT